MIALDFVDKVYTIYKGKERSKSPIFSSEKSKIVIDIANMKLYEWAYDFNQSRNSLFEIRNVDDIDVAEKTYELDTDFISPSDWFILDDSKGRVIYLDIVKPQHRKSGDCVFIHGANPKKVTFFDDMNKYDGFTLKAPGYYLPAKIVKDNDEIVCDNVMWLVYATAAELARNDHTKDDEFANLQGMANNLYMKMMLSDVGNAFMQDNTIPSNIRPIGSSEDSAFD